MKSNFELVGLHLKNPKSQIFQISSYRQIVKRKIERKMSLPSNKPVMNETILMGLLRTACCSKVNAANKKEKIIIRARGNIRINTG